MNWLTSSESGRWTGVHDGFSGSLTIGMSISMIVFFGLMTTGLGQPGDPNVDVTRHLALLSDSVSALAVGLFYMIITVIFVLLWYIASDRPDVSGAAVIDMGRPRDWLWQIPLGVVMGGLFVFGMQELIGSFFAFETLTIFGVNIEPILLILAPVLAIPIVEEFFFGGVLTPTLAEMTGVVPAALLVSLIWILWHLGTYSSSTTILGALFAFRVVMTFVILSSESLMTPIVSHIVVNFAGTFLVI